ncbi:MAG: PEGA domain-containing protein [Candidatus Aminicenantes bacterium]|nr:PEGA domain-containing protein [Candidatus Aminicenantes bacterium]
MMTSFFKTTACAALFSILLFTSGQGFSYAAVAQDELQKAEQLSKDMLYEEAVNILNNFIRANAANPDQKTKVAGAYYLLARIYFDVDEMDPQVKQNLTKVFEYDRNFTKNEINAVFRKLVEGVRSKTKGTVVQKIGKKRLKVKIGEGVSGSPRTGSYTYPKGKKIRYSYTAKEGSANPGVQLDGKTVPDKGTLTMNVNHTLTVTMAKQAAVTVNSNPEGATIYVDGMDSTQMTNFTFNLPTAGIHEFLLRKIGYKEYATTINAEFDKTKTLSQDLEKGLHEDFNAGAESSILWQWQDNPAGKWVITNGQYTATARLNNWNYSIYNFNFASSKYTLHIKMKRTVGRGDRSNGIALITGANPGVVNGYLFNYTTNGFVSFWRMTNYNIDTASGGIKALGDWGKSSTVNPGLGRDNSIKIVRQANTYTYFLNNIKTFSFTDKAHNPGYIMIGGDCGGQDTQLFFDYVYLEAGN